MNKGPTWHTYDPNELAVLQVGVFVKSLASMLERAFVEILASGK